MCPPGTTIFVYQAMMFKNIQLFIKTLKNSLSPYPNVRRRCSHPCLLLHFSLDRQPCPEKAPNVPRTGSLTEKIFTRIGSNSKFNCTCVRLYWFETTNVIDGDVKRFRKMHAKATSERASWLFSAFVNWINDSELWVDSNDPFT
jgi:hypothetical protein